jgi:hypothetical protein
VGSAGSMIRQELLSVRESLLVRCTPVCIVFLCASVICVVCSGIGHLCLRACTAALICAWVRA